MKHCPTPPTRPHEARLKLKKIHCDQLWVICVHVSTPVSYAQNQHREQVNNDLCTFPCQSATFVAMYTVSQVHSEAKTGGWQPNCTTKCHGESLKFLCSSFLPTSRYSIVSSLFGRISPLLLQVSVPRDHVAILYYHDLSHDILIPAEILSTSTFGNSFRLDVPSKVYDNTNPTRKHLMECTNRYLYSFMGWSICQSHRHQLGSKNSKGSTIHNESWELHQ